MRLILFILIVLYTPIALHSQSQGLNHIYTPFYLHFRGPLDSRNIAQDTINVTLPYEGQITFFRKLGEHLKYTGGKWSSLASGTNESSSDFSVSDATVYTGDWNNLTSAGTNPQRASGTALNGPGVTGNFYVVNVKNSDNGDLVQKALPVDYTVSHEYTRSYRINAWGPWVKSDDGRVISTESKDWNTITTPGLYKNIIQGSQPNGPGGVSFFYVRNIGRNGNVFQEALPYSGTPLDWKSRVFFGGTWTPWENVVISKASLWTSPNVSTTTDFNTITAPGLHDAIVRGTAPNGPGGTSFYFVENKIRNFAIIQEVTRYGNTTADPIYLSRTRNTDGSNTWTPWENGQDGMGDNDAGGNRITNLGAPSAGTDAMNQNATNALITPITDRLKWGSGNPEGVLSAAPGTLYLNLIGGVGTTQYVKETGTGTTGWVAK